MYKTNRNRQFSLSDFNQPVGLKMNPENRWIKKAEMIPWMEIEEKYASLFPSQTGMPAKPLQVALGSLIIQKQYDYSDLELVEQIRENPYYQFFIGLPGYQDKAPYAPSLLVEFRKRLTDDILSEINEMIAKCRKRSAKKIRKAIKKQLQYVKRDLGYIDVFMEEEDIEFTEKQLRRIKIRFANCLSSRITCIETIRIV